MKNSLRYHRLLVRGFSSPVKYIVTKGDEVHKFSSRKEVAEFFGYHKDYIFRGMKKGVKEFKEYTIKRYKWFLDKNIIAKDKGGHSR